MRKLTTKQLLGLGFTETSIYWVAEKKSYPQFYIYLKDTCLIYYVVDGIWRFRLDGIGVLPFQSIREIKNFIKLLK